MWQDKPDQAGYWLFRGKRTSRSKKLVVEVAAAVQVKDEAGFPEIVVYYPGNGAAYGLSQHEGEWFSLEEMLRDRT